MKNSSDTIGNRTRDLPSCSAVPQSTVQTTACPPPTLVLSHFWPSQILVCNRTLIRSLFNGYYLYHCTRALALTISCELWAYHINESVDRFSITVSSLSFDLLSILYVILSAANHCSFCNLYSVRGSEFPAQYGDMLIIYVPTDYLICCIRYTCARLQISKCIYIYCP
jgi:hypothetical protein